MNGIKKCLLLAGQKSGMFDLLRLLRRDRINILMYHRFSDKEEPFKMRRDVFENQIRFLRDKFNLISLGGYVKLLSGGEDGLPQNPVVLTIDDGYEDNYTFAYPVLKKYSAPATIFITTDFVTRKTWLWSDKLQYILKGTEKKRFVFRIDDEEEQFDVETFEGWHKTQLKIFNHCRRISEEEKNDLIWRLSLDLRVSVPEESTAEFSPLSWNQIREMSENGIEFGSHSCSHPILSRVTRPQMVDEIVNSKREIEGRIGKEVNTFCYPNGGEDDFNGEIIDMLRKASYSAAVTTILGANRFNEVDPYRMRRKTINTDVEYEMNRRLAG